MSLEQGGHSTSRKESSLRRTSVRINALSNALRVYASRIHTAAEALGLEYRSGSELLIAPEELNMLKENISGQGIQESSFTGAIDGQSVEHRSRRIIKFKIRQNPPPKPEVPRDRDNYLGGVIVYPTAPRLEEPTRDGRQDEERVRIEKKERQQVPKEKPEIPDGYVNSVEAARMFGCRTENLKTVRTRYGISTFQAGLSIYYSRDELLSNRELYIEESTKRKLEREREREALQEKRKALQEKRKVAIKTKLTVPDGFVDIRVACDILEVSNRTLRAVGKKFDIREFRSGGRVYFNGEDLNLARQARGIQKQERRHESAGVKPEGYLSGAEVIARLGISYDRWIKIRGQISIQTVGSGSRKFYQAADIDALVGKLPPVERQVKQKKIPTSSRPAKERKVKPSIGKKTREEMAAKTYPRKERIDVEFGNQEIEDLSSLGLHLRDVMQHPIPSFERQKLLGARIFSAKLAVVAINTVLEMGNVSDAQREKLETLKSDPAIRFILGKFQGEIEMEAKKDNEDSELLGILKRINNRIVSDIEKAKADEDETKLPALIENLAHRYSAQIARGKKSFEELVVSNLRLGIHFAKRRRNVRMSMQDLMSHAYEGLMDAAAKYDPRKGFRFSTYATYWVTQRISRGDDVEGHFVRVPAHMQEEIRRMRREDLGYLQITGESRNTELSPGVEMALKTRRIASLDTPIRQDSEATLKTLIPDSSQNVQDEGEKAVLESIVREILLTLPLRERRVLEMRFGINGNEMTLEEVGRKIGVTRERTRQIEAKVLKKIRGKVSARRLRDFIR